MYDSFKYLPKDILKDTFYINYMEDNHNGCNRVIIMNSLKNSNNLMDMEVEDINNYEGIITCDSYLRL